MICSVCGEKFCWKCLKKIDGYEHIGQAGGCQLFVGDNMVANEHGWVYEQPLRRWYRRTRVCNFERCG